MAVFESRRLRHALLAATAASCFGLAGCATTVEQPAAATTNRPLDRSLTEAAESSEQQRDHASALAYYQTLYKRGPNDMATVIGMSRNMRLLQRISEAHAVVKRALKDHGDDIGLLGEYGKVQLALGDATEAIETLSRADALGGSRWDLQVALAVAYDRMQMFDQAERAYEKSLKLSPEDARVLNNYALSLALNGRLEEAIEKLEHASALPEATAQMRQNLALLYAMHGQLQPAERLVRRDLPKDVADSNMTHYRKLAGEAGQHSDKGKLTLKALAMAAPAAVPAAPITPVAVEPVPAPQQPASNAVTEIRPAAPKPLPEPARQPEAMPAEKAHVLSRSAMVPRFAEQRPAPEVTMTPMPQDGGRGPAAAEPAMAKPTVPAEQAKAPTPLTADRNPSLPDQVAAATETATWPEPVHADPVQPDVTAIDVDPMSLAAEPSALAEAAVDAPAAVMAEPEAVSGNPPTVAPVDTDVPMARTAATAARPEMAPAPKMAGVDTAVAEAAGSLDLATDMPMALAQPALPAEPMPAAKMPAKAVLEETAQAGSDAGSRIAAAVTAGSQVSDAPIAAEMVPTSIGLAPTETGAVAAPVSTPEPTLQAAIEPEAPQTLMMAEFSPISAPVETPAPAPSGLRSASAEGRGYWLQLGSFRSPERADMLIRQLAEAHADLTEALDLDVREGTVDGSVQVYRVVSSLMTEHDKASGLCNSLKERALGCLLVKSRK